MTTLQSSYHYILFQISPKPTDELALRKSIQDALSESFGQTGASAYVDILWLNEQGDKSIVRTRPEDAPKIMSAAATSATSPRLSTLKDSSILTSLLSESTSQ
ncbi:hypothetical protein DL96DRAFT_1586842 [Flagelloscypha sp. PMI_526]|nr:hypothetical protein DL96DRAFT_1586842 [Flagelloscypha sp. PMI_526]